MPYAHVTLVAPAQHERTFRIFRATPRRSAAQNAARFIVRIGERAIGFRRVRYDGAEMIAVNYFGSNPRPVIRLQPARRFTVADDGSVWRK